ncbi:MAG: GrpB family protein [Desulfuromusa sp.]|nr:GrpB family protein [Desulfuromusa sp.]
MKILKYEKIAAGFIPWSLNYLKVSQALIEFIRTEKFEVIHIGSTSFMVGGKGIIDLSILYRNGEINTAVNHLLSLEFQDQISDKPFPPERPRKDGTVMMDGNKYFIHVHVISYGSEEHKKQLHYKEYMLRNPGVREAYELLKKEILSQGITDQEAYGKQKSPYVKSILSQL